MKQTHIVKPSFTFEKSCGIVEKKKQFVQNRNSRLEQTIYITWVMRL